MPRPLHLIAYLIVTAVCLALSSPAQADDVIETVAGTGDPADNGNQGIARQINIGEPFGVEIGPEGGLYVTEVRNHRVLRVDLATGQIATVAGNGRKGYTGDGGPATQASLNEPYEVRFDRDGNMYFVEMQNHLVRRVDAKTRIITTLAGTGKPGFGGDGGPAIQAQFQQPHSIALDGQGHLYVADIGNHRIRRIDLPTGIIETIAGTEEKKLPVDGQRARGNPLLGPRLGHRRTDDVDRASRGAQHLADGPGGRPTAARRGHWAVGLRRRRRAGQVSHVQRSQRHRRRSAW